MREKDPEVSAHQGELFDDEVEEVSSQTAYNVDEIIECLDFCPHCSSESRPVFLESGRCQSCGFVPHLDMSPQDIEKISQLQTYFDNQEEALLDIADTAYQQIDVGHIRGIDKVSYKIDSIKTIQSHGISESKRMEVSYDIVKKLSFRTGRRKNVKLKVFYDFDTKEVERDFFDGSERNTYSFYEMTNFRIHSIYRDMPSGLAKVQTKEVFEAVFLAINRAGKHLVETHLKK